MNIMLHTSEVNLITSEVTVKDFLNLNEREITRDNKFVNVGNIKPIPDFPHYYISDEGKVYSDWSGKTKELKSLKDKGRGDYLKVNLYKDKKLYKKQIHRLVLSTFQPIPEMQNYQVNHKDENPANNRLENLEWCTAKYNSNYGTRNERVSKALIANKERGKTISKALKGRIFSSSHKEAISKALKGKKFSPSRKEALSKAKKGKKPSQQCREASIKVCSKRVLQYDKNYNLIASYSSATEAGKAFNVTDGTIRYYIYNLKLYKEKYYFQYAANS